MLDTEIIIGRMLAWSSLGDLRDIWSSLLTGRRAFDGNTIPKSTRWIDVLGSLVATRGLWKHKAQELGEELQIYVGTTKAFGKEGTHVRPLWNDNNMRLLGPTPCIVSNACVSGAQAVIQAAEALIDGDCDAAGAVGGDSVGDFVVAGFDSLHARSGTPARPFDRRRNGLSLGEAGCGVLLLPSTSDPRAARLPRIISYGCSNDANHISGPSRDGSGLALAIERALDGIEKSVIRAICAHGTATQYNDAMEARAFHTVFDGHPPPVFGIKGAIGHTLGAAGLIEVIVSAKVATEGVIPPTVGFEQGETDFPLDVVHGEPRKIKPGYVLTTNSGFGGMNTAIVVGPGDA